MNALKMEVSSPEDLPKAAGKLLNCAEDVRVFAFFGEMGAGKTTFIKAICEKLGVDEQEISSPTFSLVNEYLGRDDQVVYHFDFYRIKKEGEVYDIGYEDYIYSGAYCFVEWPEKIINLLPEKYVKVRIEVNNGKRSITAQI